MRVVSESLHESSSERCERCCFGGQPGLDRRPVVEGGIGVEEVFGWLLLLRPIWTAILEGFVVFFIKI